MSRGGRGLLATISGAVACELEPLGIDESGARYELRITNGTPGVLAATVSALRLDESRPVAALAVDRPEFGVEQVALAPLATSNGGTASHARISGREEGNESGHWLRRGRGGATVRADTDKGRH